MIIKDLIEQLKKFDENLEIKISYEEYDNIQSSKIKHEDILFVYQEERKEYITIAGVSVWYI